jgi:PAS domain S-box-containing protein
MWVYDRETLRFLAVNQAAVERYGYTQEEFSRMTLEDIRPPAEVQRLLAHCRDLTVDRHLRSQGEWRHRTRDGREIEVEIIADEISFGGRSATLVVAFDVTERKKLEAHLLHSQKLEAMGRLAGSVAHDFNNVLAVVSGYTDLLFREVAAEDPRRRRLEHIRKALESGATLAGQLLAFSRRDPVCVVPLELGAVVREAEPMVSRLMGLDHQLVTALCAAPTVLSADKAQLQQVILNLAANARDAMPRGGKLVIETRSVALDQAFARTHLGARPGPYVVLSVSDTGEGMDAATRSRIFEPFFTTKPKGQGTGLGLATVYDVVKRAGGYISVYSEPGQGSTFNIYFPALPERADAAAGEAAVVSGPAGSRQATILLVEDRDALRSIMRELLESYGYVVLEADRADAALDLAANHAGAIDLLLTDVIMPGMRGPELAAWLRERRPDLRVLFMSGYTDEALAAQGAVERGMLFIQKPFSTADLLGKVAGALQQPA